MKQTSDKEWGREKFNALMQDTGLFLQNADKLVPLAKSVTEMIHAAKEYEAVVQQLEVVKIKRDLILREFESIDRAVDKIFNEREKTLKQGNDYIEWGLKKNNPTYVETGLQIIKLVLLSNPFESLMDKARNAKDKYNIVEQHLE